eukprot:288946_1
MSLSFTIFIVVHITKSSSLLKDYNYCAYPLNGPVVSGIDFVDLRNQFEEQSSNNKQNVSLIPKQGNNAIVANYSLYNYQFWFLNVSNMNLFQN